VSGVRSPRGDAIGPRGIRYRVESLGGAVHIASAPASATSILVELPVAGPGAG
jgi:signal transduction histidine kinase